MRKNTTVQSGATLVPTSALHKPTEDTRVQRSKEQVMQVTLELLTEHGLGGVSVDEVARRSGVAKTTIYRHWPTRSELMLDACTRLSTQSRVPDTGSFEGDLRMLMTGMAQMLQSARWATVMPSIIDAAERDPNLAEIHSRIQVQHSAPFQAIITRAVERGELPPIRDAQAMIADLLGPLYYRRWFSREPLDEVFISGVSERVLGRTRKPRPTPEP